MTCFDYNPAEIERHRSEITSQRRRDEGRRQREEARRLNDEADREIKRGIEQRRRAEADRIAAIEDAERARARANVEERLRGAYLSTPGATEAGWLAVKDELIARYFADRALAAAHGGTDPLGQVTSDLMTRSRI